MPSDVIVICGKDPVLLDGGFESFMRAYGKALQSIGYSPHFFCVSDRTEVEETEFGTVHRHWSPFRPFRTIMIPLHSPFVIRNALTYLRDVPGPVLIHSLAQWAGPGAAVTARLRRRGVKAVHLTTPFTTYNHETKGKLKGMQAGVTPWNIRLKFRLEMLWIELFVDSIERRGFRDADLIVPNYDSVRAIVDAEFGPNLRFGKITYAAETAFSHQDSAPSPMPEPLRDLANPEAPLIVAVSRHDPRKGLDILLHALARLKAEGIAFRACLVGRGDLLDYHRQLHAQLGLGATTVLPGLVPDPFAYLEHGDIFVLPSIEEGSGSVSLLEAMQAGLAPVVSNVDGLPEDVTEGDNGLLVRPGDVEDLARQLKRLLTDTALRERLAAGARTTFEQRFSAGAFSADLKRVFTQFGFEPSSD